VVRLVPVLALALAACTYHAGSFATRTGGAFPGTRLTRGCLDLAVLVSPPHVTYSFGNRCAHHVTVDLASVRVIARDAAGGVTELTAYDPRHEIRPAALDALLAGWETIAYGPPAAIPADLAAMCVDVGGVDADVPRAPRWICDRGAP
jgi:hypothetical protein